eukprot:EG_transcript_451
MRGQEALSPSDDLHDSTEESDFSFNTSLKTEPAQRTPYKRDFWMDDDGIMRWRNPSPTPDLPVPYPEYFQDVRLVRLASENATCKRACRNRLVILEMKMEMHRIMNVEFEGKNGYHDHRPDIFAHMKVDNSVRLATAMNCQSLLDFIIEKARSCPDDVVNVDDRGQPVELRDLLHRYGVYNPEQLSVEGLGLQPGPTTRFHRFDIFSSKYSQGGQGSVEVLLLFLKTRNYIKGKYFGELIKPLLLKHDEPDSNVATEYKVPIFGSDRDEWAELARWMATHGLYTANNRWIIQVPRILHIRNVPNFYKCETLQEQLLNIFTPMWDATMYPRAHPQLAQLLAHVAAFNVISDEVTRGQELPENRPPKDWPWAENPPDIYFNYYVWANLYALNTCRQSRGLNTFQYRPNCGEVGESEHHLVSAFLLADSINHGIRLESSPVLQYLYYLAQIGMCLAPLANNGLHVRYEENPFPVFFKRGLRVALSTDDPLHFHHTKEAVVEEYGTAAKIYKLNDHDMVEIARNSILISGFPADVKRRWLNGPGKASLVRSIRTNFRDQVLDMERTIINSELKRYKKQLRRTTTALSHPLTPPGVLAKSHQLRELKASGQGESQLAMELEINIVREQLQKGKELGEAEIKFHRVEMAGPTVTDDKAVRAANLLRYAMELRHKYIWKHPLELWRRKDVKQRIDLDYHVELTNGTPHVYRRLRAPGSGSDPHRGPLMYTVPDVKAFLADYGKILDIVEDVDVKTLAAKRLRLLEHKFILHNALNALEEGDDGTEKDTHRDFCKVYKVDTHVHMAAGMTARQLLEFLLEKAQNHADDPVMDSQMRDPTDPNWKKIVTLGGFLKANAIDPKKLNVDMLNVQADASMYERFDKFKMSYNLLGNKHLRDLLMRSDNFMGGRYFAELIKGRVFKQMEKDEYTFAENRISVYGKRRNEWNQLAQWFHTHGMGCVHNKWMVQIPRAFHNMKGLGSFQALLENIFMPLWEVSIDPRIDPILDNFLAHHMSGFDCVDNEATPDMPFPEAPPSEWVQEVNPPYGFWMYYLWANITVLNMFRSTHGRSTFSFRPHCGEAGAVDHLASCFLLANAINHGINAIKNPAVEYLYYLGQIGMAVSPLSNNTLFLEYIKNPFPRFFRRGLNVSLSTDDPLQFHHTQEPLIEEYCVAAKMWKLSGTDMCEIARNSVLQSGFPHEVKASWLGDLYFLSSSNGNVVSRSHVPDIRLAYRFELYHAEVNYLEAAAEKGPRDRGWFKRSMYTKEEEDAIVAQAGRAHRRKGRRAARETRSRAGRASAGPTSDNDSSFSSPPPSPSNASVLSAFRPESRQQGGRPDAQPKRDRSQPDNYGGLSFDALMEERLQTQREIREVQHALGRSPAP